MRPTKFQLAIAAATIVAIFAAVLVVTRGDLWPERHTDGWGPLSGHLSSPGSFSGAGPMWTLAIYVCLDRGAEPAVLDGPVTGSTRIGNGFDIVGSVARQGVPKRGFQVIGAVDGFPPRAPFDQFQKAKGFAVNNTCTNDISRPFTELDFGVRRSKDGGGGWSGFEVGYSVGLRHHVLSVEGPNVICGSGLATDVSADLCSSPVAPQA